MVITRIWLSGRQSRSVHNCLQQPNLGLHKSARYQKPKENQIPILVIIKHFADNWFDLGASVEPGSGTKCWADAMMNFITSIMEDPFSYSVSQLQWACSKVKRYWFNEVRQSKLLDPVQHGLRWTVHAVVVKICTVVIRILTILRRRPLQI